MCFGSADLVRLDAAGRKRWLMQADEVLYLHPDRVRLQGPAIDVDADPLPDVVLEVDHTTDVRRRKLGISTRRADSPRSGCWCHGRHRCARPGWPSTCAGSDGYREEASSRAFPGWKAEEIHLALTEAPLSEAAWRALERTALAMGAREGTRPEDDPLIRSVSLKADAKGYVRGREEGQREMLAANVFAVLKARGIEAALHLPEHRELFSGHSGEALMAAALACTGDADFRQRILEQRGPHAELPPYTDPEQ